MLSYFYFNHNQQSSSDIIGSYWIGPVAGFFFYILNEILIFIDLTKTYYLVMKDKGTYSSIFIGNFCSWVIQKYVLLLGI